MLIVETSVAAGDWDGATDWVTLADRACRAALTLTPHAALADGSFACEVAVRLTDDAEVESLNAQYRGKQRPTNVLSFPMVQPDLLDGIADSDDGEVLLGDIILASETIAREAVDQDIAPRDHAAHLIVHGMLHLLGYDHDDDGAAEHMEAIETSACAALGLCDPYAARDPASSRDQ